MVSKSNGIPARQLGAALGISHTMVRKYAKRGMPTGSESAALAWLATNTAGRFAENGPPECPEEPSPELEADRDEVSTSSGVSSEPNAFAETADIEGVSQAELTKRLTAARIKLTNRDVEIRRLQGRQAQMDADLRDGKLLRAEDEHRKGFERALTLRNKFLSLPAEWAVQLAAITDPAIVAAFTRKHLKAALIEYCAAYGVTTEPAAETD